MFSLIDYGCCSLRWSLSRSLNMSLSVLVVNCVLSCDWHTYWKYQFPAIKACDMCANRRELSQIDSMFSLFLFIEWYLSGSLSVLVVNCVLSCDWYTYWNIDSWPSRLSRIDYLFSLIDGRMSLSGLLSMSLSDWNINSWPIGVLIAESSHKLIRCFHWSVDR